MTALCLVYSLIGVFQSMAVGAPALLPILHVSFERCDPAVTIGHFGLYDIVRGGRKPEKITASVGGIAYLLLVYVWECVVIKRLCKEY